ncbi:MAG: polysaccharide deacetylase family protein, partial [Acidimicrobiales bacterium]
FYGSAGALPLKAPVVAMAATPDGRGYWLAAADGGVFTYGDARFYGSAGATPFLGAMAGIARTPDGRGYWLAASDGAVLPYGDARSYGSAERLPLGHPVVAIAATPDGRGYWIAASDGGVFTYGDATFHGSTAGAFLPAPVVGIAVTPDGHGYWVLVSTPRPPVPASGLSAYYVNQVPASGYGPRARVVALTFDDGPSPYTPAILDTLLRYHVPATFSIIGREGQAYHGILRQEVADGFGLQNHTWDHPPLAQVSPQAFASEVDRTTRLLQGVLGHPVTCLRPPYGSTDAAVASGLGRRDLVEMLWSIDPSDYQRPGAAVIARRVLSALVPGAVILLHDGGGDRAQTVAALPAIIEGIRRAHYQIVPVCQ